MTKKEEERKGKCAVGASVTQDTVSGSGRVTAPVGDSSWVHGNGSVSKNYKNGSTGYGVGVTFEWEF